MVMLRIELVPGLLIYISFCFRPTRKLLMTHQYLNWNYHTRAKGMFLKLEHDIHAQISACVHEDMYNIHLEMHLLEM